MKKFALLIFVLFISLLVTYGQSPQAFKYQAVIRDTLGNVLTEQLISLKISIIKGSVKGETVYSEIHDISTSELGMVNLEVGRGLVTNGVFSDIPWGEDDFFIQIEIDPTGGMNYQLMGTSQLLSVPYALYAESAGNQAVPDQIWQETEGGIYYDGGFVGLGTDNPNVRLHIEGKSTGQDGRLFLLLKNNSSDQFSNVALNLYAGKTINHFGLEHLSDNYLNPEYASTSLLWNVGNGLILRTQPEGRISFETSDATGRFVKEHMRMTGDGKLGLGTINPEVPFHIVNESYGTSGRLFALFHNKSLDANSNVYLNLTAGHATSICALGHHSDTYSLYGGIYANTTVLHNYGEGLILRSDPAGRISFEITATDGRSFNEYIRMKSNGFFGIGNLDPQRPLHVSDVMRLEPRYSAPENPSEGDIYMDGNDHKLKVFDGSEWRACWE